MLEESSAIVMQSHETTGDNLVRSLRQQGWNVRGCRSPRQLLALMHGPVADAYVLAGPIDTLCGATTTVRAGAPDAAVVLLADDATTTSRIAALHAGADICCPPDIDICELDAVIRAQHRKGVPMLLQWPPRRATWRVDAAARELAGPDGERLPLTASERAFFARLLSAPGNCLPRELIFPKQLVTTGSAARHVDVLVSRMRSKARRLGFALPVLAVRGWGYILLTKRENT